MTKHKSNVGIWNQIAEKGRKKLKTERIGEDGRKKLIREKRFSC